MNAKAIIEAYLKEHGYDGLFLDGACACALDDLMPCLMPGADCEAGHILKCEGGMGWDIGEREANDDL